MTALFSFFFFSFLIFSIETTACSYFLYVTFWGLLFFCWCCCCCCWNRNASQGKKRNKKRKKFSCLIYIHTRASGRVAIGKATGPQRGVCECVGVCVCVWVCECVAVVFIMESTATCCHRDNLGEYRRRFGFLLPLFLIYCRWTLWNRNENVFRLRVS